MKKLTLIDGNSLMFRSYYATAYSGNLMQNRKGLYTNAVFGFANMFTKLLTDNHIDYIFVAFDAGSETFRHQAFESYKGTRKKLPEELKVQIPYVKEYLDILNIPRHETLEYEADDLLASVCEQARLSFDEIEIITGDKDLLQLVDTNVKVLLTRKGIGELEEYNQDNFYDKTNMHPFQVVDYKGLVGDSSDNLPGIRGVGEKTALKLLETYQTLENIYEHIGELKGKTQQLFIEHEDIARTCKYLATLKKDTPLEFSLEELKYQGADTLKLLAFLKEMEFHSLLRRVGFEREDTSKDHSSVIWVDDLQYDFKQQLQQDAIIIAEVVGKNYYKNDFLGIALMLKDQVYFVTRKVLEQHQELRAYLKDHRYAKKTFDLKLVYVVLKQCGIQLNNVTFDLLLAAYLINPMYANEDFKVVSEYFAPSNLDFYDAIYGANTKIKEPDPSVLSQYSEKKCRLLEKIESSILQTHKEQELEALFEMEMKLSTVLGEMELAGLVIDQSKLAEVGVLFEEKAKEYAEKVFDAANVRFNLNSPKQLGDVLFEQMKLPHGKKNKTGYSTNVDVLEKLSQDYQIARDILEYRSYYKLFTTYVKGLQEVIYKDGKIHPLYKQALTSTGRLSSFEPNIQNMPIRTEIGQTIREIFVSRFENGIILSADYSQIELRVLAHMSEDEVMIEAFQLGVDFHSQTAANLYEIPLNEVNKEMRRIAKAINFGIIYGMSSWGLSETIRSSQEEASKYIEKYFHTYRKTKDFLDGMVAFVKDTGYSKTAFGRRRYIPEIADKNPNIKNFGERTAMNAPIQGTAADIIKMAMVQIKNRLDNDRKESLLIAQVHDELVFDCIPSELEYIKKMVKEEMEQAVSLKVPLTAGVSYGRNWFEAK